MTYFPLINKKIGSLAVGLCLAGAVCLPAEAVLTTRYTFDGGGLSDGGTLSGYFDYDGSTYSNWSITTTLGSDNGFPTFTYTTISSDISNDSNLGFILKQTGLDAGKIRQLEISFTSAISGSTADSIFLAQSTAPLYDDPSRERSNLASSLSTRGLTADLVVTAAPSPVPLESDALSVVVAGTFLSGAYWLKRRRSAKSVAELSLSDDENN